MRVVRGSWWAAHRHGWRESAADGRERRAPKPRAGLRPGSAPPGRVWRAADVHVVTTIDERPFHPW